MQKVLKNISDEQLRAYIIWLPILPNDDRAAAEKRSSEFADPRLTYFWDGHRLTGRVWQRVLDLSGIAWDIYFLYGAEARWESEPTIPDFWMHQLSVAAEKALFLNEPDFELKVKELLDKVKSADHPKEVMSRVNQQPPDIKLATVTIQVEGMTCGGCAVSVQQALAKREGVKSVEVSFEKKQAIVKYDPAKLTPQQLAEVINQTGFKAKL